MTEMESEEIDRLSRKLDALWQVNAELRFERDRLVALARRAPALTWHQIDAYDKNPAEGGMKIVLLFIPKDGYWNMATGAWSRGHNAWEFDRRILKDYDYQPTHFMPLPPAPPEARP